jgi:hypothetical protein
MPQEMIFYYPNTLQKMEQGQPKEIYQLQNKRKSRGKYFYLTIESHQNKTELRTDKNQIWIKKDKAWEIIFLKPDNQRKQYLINQITGEKNER